MQLAFWSVALAVGIAGGLGLAALSLQILAAAVCVVAAAFLGLRARNLAAGALCLVAGLGLGWAEVRRAEAPAPVEEDRLVEVTAQVVRGSDVTAAHLGLPEDGSDAASPSPPPVRSHLRLRLDSVDGKPVAAELALTVLDGVPAFAPGDWLHFSSRLYLPRGFANPGLPDGRLLARGQGIDLLACVRRPADLHPAEGPTGPLAYARRWAFRLRQAMAAAIDRRLAEPAAGFVRTMVVGERTVVPTAVEEGFRAAGATHVLSVSGLHLAVVVALVFQCLKWLAGRFPSWALRLAPKTLASALALPVTAFYTLLTGEAVATVRSAIMASVVLGAAVVNRPFALGASLGAAALLLLLQSPAAILDVSFQLSFASVIALGLFARWLLPAGATARAIGWRRGPRWLLRSLSASCAACLITLPIVAHHFGEITPAAPLGNLALVPIVELVVLPCGLAGALLGILHPGLGAIPLWAAGLASRLALAVAERFRRFAPVYLVRYPNWLETLLLVAGAACLLRGLSPGTRGRKPWFVAALAAVVLAGASLSVREVIRRTHEDLRVTFLDVGQGDSALIEGPGGFTALVDGGGSYDGSFDTGARIVEPVLRAAGIVRLDLVVLSHPHPDHMNGLLRVLERFPVGALWTHGDDGGNPGFAKLVALAERRAVPHPRPATIVREPREELSNPPAHWLPWAKPAVANARASRTLVIDALGPWYDGHVGVPPGLATNDASLVLRLGFAGRRLLLPGDIGEEGEAELLDRRREGLDLSAAVLKVPHHGSRHASSEAFLRAVSPTLAVASAGRFNRFGLPSRAALDRYAAHGVRLLRTDRDGAVTVTIDPRGTVGTVCQRGCGP